MRTQTLLLATLANTPPIIAGSGILAKPCVAKIVQDALLHFEDQRSHMVAWCIMPNHVHSVVAPCAPHSLSQLLHSWKSYTAHAINKALNAEGRVWQRESFCRAIRSVEELERAITYVEANPVEALLVARPEEWQWSSAFDRFQPSSAYRFNSPCDLPFTQLRDRGQLPMLDKPGVTQFVTWRLADAVIGKRVETIKMSRLLCTPGGSC